MIYDWSTGFTHQYMGVSFDYAGGAIASSGNGTANGCFMLLIQ